MHGIQGSRSAVSSSGAAATFRAAAQFLRQAALMNYGRGCLLMSASAMADGARRG